MRAADDRRNASIMIINSDERLIDRSRAVRAGRLHHEYVGPPDVRRSETTLPCPESASTAPARLDAKKPRNFLHQLRMRAPGKTFSSPNNRHEGLPISAQPRGLAGAEGFEPSNTGSKVPRLTAWPRPIVVTGLRTHCRAHRALSNSGDFCRRSCIADSRVAFRIAVACRVQLDGFRRS